MNNGLQEFIINFFEKYLCKTFLVENFVRNTCEIYNFIRNNYSRRNYLPIKIYRKNSKKNLFLQNIIMNLQEKNPQKIKNSSSVFRDVNGAGRVRVVALPYLTR